MFKVFAVFDEKADAFDSVIAIPTEGLAMRGFVQGVMNPQSPMRQYPSDYKLYVIGEFDPRSGTIVGYKTPVLVMSAVQALETLRNEEARQLKIPGTVDPVGEKVS